MNVAVETNLPWGTTGLLVIPGDPPAGASGLLVSSEKLAEGMRIVHRVGIGRLVRLPLLLAGLDRVKHIFGAVNLAD